jgi:DNA polymerase-1
MFPAYKANRGELRAFFEIEYLKKVLPSLGISQAWHPEEEADDVIATLLRGPLKGQQNIVVGTDRDLLQLVTETDHMFVPAVGAGKEHYFDIATVEEEYGVPPERIVHYRAIDGDTSDNIPGAPGFGPKLASKLLKSYGTVDGVFASSLVGLTPKQYTSLRASEKQVRLNVELMVLRDNLALTLTHPNPDRTVAAERLQNVDVKVESILPVFFPVLGGGA